MPDYRSLAEAELAELRERAARLETAIAVMDELDGTSPIVEEPPTVKPGTGEDEAAADDLTLIDDVRRRLSVSGDIVPVSRLVDELSRSRPGVKRQSVYATLNRLKKLGEFDNVEGVGWGPAPRAESERRFMEGRPEVYDLADCLGWDIQHYRKRWPERAHLVALILHVHSGVSEGSYTLEQANAVLQRLIRSAPTILDAVDAVLAGGEASEGEPGTGDTTESRERSAAAGIRAVRAKYGENYREVPWPK